MMAGILPLIGVLIGAVIGAGGVVYAQWQQERREVINEMRQIRREQFLRRREVYKGLLLISNRLASTLSFTAHERKERRVETYLKPFLDDRDEVEALVLEARTELLLEMGTGSIHKAFIDTLVAESNTIADIAPKYSSSAVARLLDAEYDQCRKELLAFIDARVDNLEVLDERILAECAAEFDEYDKPLQIVPESQLIDMEEPAAYGSTTPSRSRQIPVPHLW